MAATWKLSVVSSFAELWEPDLKGYVVRLLHRASYEKLFDMLHVNYPGSEVVEVSNVRSLLAIYCKYAVLRKKSIRHVRSILQESASPFCSTLAEPCDLFDKTISLKN